MKGTDSNEEALIKILSAWVAGEIPDVKLALRQIQLGELSKIAEAATHKVLALTYGAELLHMVFLELLYRTGKIQDWDCPPGGDGRTLMITLKFALTHIKMDFSLEGVR